MAPRLLFTRHGETIDNDLHRLSTSPPGPGLNEQGREQARMLADLVRDRAIDAIYCSPLTRAKETALMVAEGRDIPVVEDWDLRELSVGELEGRSDRATFDGLERVWKAWTVDKLLDMPAGPNGETGHQTIRRTTAAVARIVESHPDGTVLVVAHSGVLQILLPHLSTNLEPQYGYQNWLRNCQIVELEPDGQAHRCVAWADQRFTFDT